MSNGTCSIAGCTDTHYAKTYCSKHWQRWRKFGDPHHVIIRTRAQCSIDGCERLTAGRGWCLKHWQRWKKHGDPIADVKERPTFGMSRDEAFAHYMPGQPPNDGSCWIWTGTVSNEYGSFRAGGRTYKAHRASYEIYIGPIPDGLLIRHDCDTPLCVNPFHLRPGTDADNNRDMMERARNRQTKGVDQGSAKLTDDKIIEIRKLYARGGISQQAIADQYGVHQTCISGIVRHTGWKHVVSS